MLKKSHNLHYATMTRSLLVPRLSRILCKDMQRDVRHTEQQMTKHREIICLIFSVLGLTDGRQTHLHLPYVYLYDFVW
jgi:hypothetical protein